MRLYGSESRVRWEALAATARSSTSRLSLLQVREWPRAVIAALRARLALTASRTAAAGVKARKALALTELDEALRLEPGSLFALKAKMAEVPADQRVSLARQAVAAHSHEGEAWLLLASALEGTDPQVVAECESSYKKAVELAPRNARAANALAWLYVTQGRYAEALPLATRAVELAPWSASILDTYAMTVAGLGRCTEAIQAEQRAIDLLQEHASPELVKEFRARLASFSPTSCAPKLTP